MKKENLFELVHALSASEKRSFRSFVQGGSQQDAKYLLLFDLVARQKKYDEKALLNDPAFENKPNRLGVAKNYLFQQILKSLRNTSTNRTVELYILEMLLDIETLYDRQMFVAASKIADKIRKQAEDYMYYDLLITICGWERKLTDQINDGGKYSNIYESILERENFAAHQLRINTIYFNQYKKLKFSNLKEGLIKRGTSLDKFLRNLQYPELEDFQMATNPLAKLLYHFCYIEYYYAMREFNNLYQLNKQVMNLFVKYPNLKIKSLKFYLKSLISFLETQLHLKMLEEFDQNISTLENFQIPTHAHDLKRLQELEHLTLILYRCFAAGNYEEAISELIPRIETYFDTYDHQMVFREELVLKLQVAWVYLGVGDHEKSLEWMAPLEMQINPEYFTDNYTTFCILNLMIHYELRDTKAIVDIADNLFDFLKSRNKMSSNEAFLIRFFRRAAENLEDRARQKELLLQLKEQNLTLKRYVPTIPVYPVDCVIWWVDSILQRKTVASMVTEYAPVPNRKEYVDAPNEEFPKYPGLFNKEGIKLLEQTNLVG